MAGAIAVQLGAIHKEIPMFGFGKSKEEKELDAFAKSSLGKRLQAHNLEYFGEGKVFGKYSEETKNHVMAQLYDRVFGVMNAEDQFMQMRLELSTLVFVYSRYQVLMRIPPGAWKFSTDHADGWGSTYVSGELHKHILECAPHQSELAEEVWRRPDISAEQLLEYTWLRLVKYSYFMNGINILRADFEDVIEPKNKDWFQPFIVSMMVVSEDYYRSKIGLPSIMKDKIVRAITYNAFFNIVKNGHKNPLFEWEKDFGKFI